MARDWWRGLIVYSAILATSTAYAGERYVVPNQQSQRPPIGLGTWIRPIKTDEFTLNDQARLIAQEKKDRVHFFLINGLDPAYAGNLNGIASYFRSIGFVNTNSYQFPSAPKVRKQIEAIRHNNPDARIVLLGFSLGANYARRLANELQRDGIFLDCLIYLGGDMIFNNAQSTPSNIGEIVNITGHGLIFLGRDIYFKGDNLDGAANYRLDARHITIPAQPEVINIIGPRLINLANTAPMLPE
jgi:hypothetical protein